jgi:hypothetical protein
MDQDPKVACPVAGCQIAHESWLLAEHGSEAQARWFGIGPIRKLDRHWLEQSDFLPDILGTVSHES